MERITLTAQEGAAYIGCSYWQILEMVKRGEIPCIHIGRRVLFRQAVLDQWLTDMEQASVKPEEVPQVMGLRRVRA